jgi:zinc transporter
MSVTIPTEELHGLVWGYRFDDTGSSTRLDGAAAIRALEDRDSWIWLHFDLGDQRALHFLKNLPCVPAEALAILTGTDERQHMDHIADTHGSVIAGVAMDFERTDDIPDVRKMIPWRFCMMPHAFISARRHPLLTMQQMNFNIMGGSRFDSVLHLFDAILHSYISALAKVSHSLTEQLDTVEDDMLEDREIGDFEVLSSVRRSATRLTRQTMPLREMITHLLSERPKWFTSDAADDCNHVLQRLLTVAADLTALQERARALVDEINSRQAEQTNKRLMLLTVLSGVMLPPTLISGIFGMNVDGLPWREGPLGFSYAIGLMLLSVIGLLIWLRKLRLV